MNESNDPTLASHLKVGRYQPLSTRSDSRSLRFCLYNRHDSVKVMTILLYIDDLLMTGKRPKNNFLRLLISGKTGEVFPGVQESRVPLRMHSGQRYF